MERDADPIRFGRAAKKSEVRWRACNEDTLTRHIASFEKLMRNKEIDALQLYNIDETGVTPNNDKSERINPKFVLCSGKWRSSQMRSKTVKYVEGVKMMAAVCDDSTW